MQPSTTSGACRLQASVAMCTYNGAQYLTEQLESITRQTQQPSELIVCDDGSTDRTIALITEFSRTAPFPVRLVCNHTKLGPAKNFDQAIGLCSGEIIFLCDQDDVWHKGKIERCLRVFESHPEGYYVLSDAQTIGPTGELLAQTLWGAMRFRPEDFTGSKQLQRLLKGNVITGAGLAFRSSFRKIALPIPAGWMHDQWIGLVGSVISDGILVPETLYNYRRHIAQVCGWRKKNFIQVCSESLECNEETSRSKLQAFQALLERLGGTDIIRKPSPERMELLRQKEFHLRQRAAVRSGSGFFRVYKVLVEALSGRYGRFSNSHYSILRDIAASLKPARKHGTYGQ